MVECENEAKNKNGEKIKKEDRCKSLEGRSRTKNGGYSGGKHGKLTDGEVKTGLESHHIPAKASYPNKLTSSESNNAPAILMERSEHTQTMSHSNGYVAQIYKGVQKKLIENNLMVVAMAMDIANIKEISKPPDKYDNAMTEMILWSICAGKI